MGIRYSRSIYDFFSAQVELGLSVALKTFGSDGWYTDWWINVVEHCFEIGCYKRSKLKWDSELGSLAEEYKFEYQPTEEQIRLPQGGTATIKSYTLYFNNEKDMLIFLLKWT